MTARRTRCSSTATARCSFRLTVPLNLTDEASCGHAVTEVVERLLRGLEHGLYDGMSKTQRLGSAGTYCRMSCSVANLREGPRKRWTRADTARKPVSNVSADEAAMSATLLLSSPPSPGAGNGLFLVRVLSSLFFVVDAGGAAELRLSARRVAAAHEAVAPMCVWCKYNSPSTMSEGSPHSTRSSCSSSSIQKRP